MVSCVLFTHPKYFCIRGNPTLPLLTYHALFTDIAAICRQYGHIQEVILQPYSPSSPAQLTKHRELLKGLEPSSSSSSVLFDLNDLPALIILARAILPPEVAIQIPPNLVRWPDVPEGEEVSDSIQTVRVGETDENLLLACLRAGASDLGGISPVDEVNNKYTFPPVRSLRNRLGLAGFDLRRRLPVHDRWISKLSPQVADVVMRGSIS